MVMMEMKAAAVEIVCSSILLVSRASFTLYRLQKVVLGFLCSALNRWLVPLRNITGRRAHKRSVRSQRSSMAVLGVVIFSINLDYWTQFPHTDSD